MCKLTDPGTTHFTISSIGLSHSGPTPPCTGHPRARLQTARARPCTPEPAEMFKAPNSKPAYSALPIPSHRNHNRESCPHFPLTSSSSWPILVLPFVALCGMPCHLLVGISESNNFFLRGSHFVSVFITIPD